MVPAFAHGQFEIRGCKPSRFTHCGHGPLFVLNVLRSAPRVAAQVWRTFLAADTKGRLILSPFALAIAAVLTRALVGGLGHYGGAGASVAWHSI